MGKLYAPTHYVEQAKWYIVCLGRELKMPFCHVILLVQVPLQCMQASDNLYVIDRLLKKVMF